MMEDIIKEGILGMLPVVPELFVQKFWKEDGK